MDSSSSLTPGSEAKRKNTFSKPEPDQGLRRGVSPPILLAQVRLTAPFIFLGEGKAPYLDMLRETSAALDRDPCHQIDHTEYFQLCASAHWTTVATFVPTDVDNQIRFRLWSPHLETSELVRMAEVAMACRSWDARPVSARWVMNPVSPAPLSGHDGEWFSIAVGAYGALRLKEPSKAAEVFAAIVSEMDREAALFERFLKDGDGIQLLKCATIISHNLGDLDRVVDLWNLPDDDRLKLAAYKAGHENPERWNGMLVLAGKLNKLLMVDENHRHFALRGPKSLRTTADLLLPIGPFFDDWGSKVARHPSLTPEEIGKISEALIDGWQWLADKKGGGPQVPVGYARALAGIIESFPGGLNALCDCLPARNAKKLKTGVLRNQCAIPRQRFEEQWRRMALNAAH